MNNDVQENDQKLTGAKKVKILQKSASSCPSTLQRNFWILFILWLNFWNFGQLLQNVETFFQNIFGLKSLSIVCTLVVLMWSGIKKIWMTSSLYVYYWVFLLQCPTIEVFLDLSHGNHESKILSLSECPWVLTNVLIYFVVKCMSICTIEFLLQHPTIKFLFLD